MFSYTWAIQEGNCVNLSCIALSYISLSRRNAVRDLLTRNVEVIGDFSGQILELSQIPSEWIAYAKVRIL